MVLSGGRRVEQGMIHNPTGFLGALSNVTKSAEDFVTGRIGGSLGESTFAMLGAGGSPAASMIAAGSGALSKLTMFAANAQSAMGQQQQVPGLSYNPVQGGLMNSSIDGLMNMQVAPPSFGGAAPAHSAPPAAQGAGSGGFNIDASGKPSGEIDEAKREEFTAAIAEKGYGTDEAAKLLEVIEKKAGGDAKRAASLLSSMPKAGGDDWRKNFATWYATKILGKSWDEATRVVGEKVYGKGAEVQLKRTSGGDKKDKKDKKVTVAHAFTVTSGGSDVMAAGSVYHRLSDGKWMAEESSTLKEFAPLQGATGEVNLTDDAETTLTLKSDYRDGVKGMDVRALIDHLNTAFTVETVKDGGGATADDASAPRPESASADGKVEKAPPAVGTDSDASAASKPAGDSAAVTASAKVSTALRPATDAEYVASIQTIADVALNDGFNATLNDKTVKLAFKSEAKKNEFKAILSDSVKARRLAVAINAMLNALPAGGSLQIGGVRIAKATDGAAAVGLLKSALLRSA